MYRLTAPGFVPSVHEEEFWQRRYAVNRTEIPASTRGNRDTALRKWIVWVRQAIASKRYPGFIGMADDLGIICAHLEDVMVQMKSESSLDVKGTLMTSVQALCGLKKCQSGGLKQEDGWNSGGDQISTIIQRAAVCSALEKSLAPTEVDGSFLTTSELERLYDIAQGLGDSYIGTMAAALIGVGIYGFMRFQDLADARLAHLVVGQSNKFFGPDAMKTIALGLRRAPSKNQSAGVPEWHCLVEHRLPYACPFGFLVDHNISLLQIAPILDMIRAEDPRWHEYRVFSRKDPLAALLPGTYYWLDACVLGKILDEAEMVKAQGKEMHLLRNTLTWLLQQLNCEYARIQKKAGRDRSVQERHYEARIAGKDQPTDALLGDYGKDYKKHHILSRRAVPLPAEWEAWAEDLVPGIFQALNEVKARNVGVRNGKRKDPNGKKRSREEKASRNNSQDAEGYLEFTLEGIRVFIANMGLKVDRLSGPQFYQMTRAIPAAMRIFQSAAYQVYAAEVKAAHEEGLRLFERLTIAQDPLEAEDRIAQRVISAMKEASSPYVMSTPLTAEPDLALVIKTSFNNSVEDAATPIEIQTLIPTPQKLITSSADLTVFQAYQEFYHGLLGIGGGVLEQRAKIGSLCSGDITKISKSKHLPMYITKMVECDGWALEDAISLFQGIKEKFRLTIAKLRECVQYTFPTIEPKGKANMYEWNSATVLKGVTFTLGDFLEATGLQRCQKGPPTQKLIRVGEDLAVAFLDN